MNIDIAAFKAEYARRSGMTVFQRINEDAAKAKASHTEKQAAQARWRTRPVDIDSITRGIDTQRRVSRYWWVSLPLWEQPGGRDISTLSRPTETIALVRVYVDARRHKTETALFRVMLREVLCEQAAERAMRLAVAYA